MSDWRNAACRDHDPELWWDKDRQREAQDICLSCPVAAECLAHAIELGDVEGVWGGLTQEGRRAWAAHINARGPVALH